ncbi:MAG: PAS domain S-box protein, partial [Mariprofundaceae bacterium]
MAIISDMNEFQFQSGHKIRYGLKILVAISLVELAIMSLFRIIGLDAGPWWLGVLDALLLATIASLAIFIWVIKPLSEAAERNQIFEQVSDSLDDGLVVTDARRADNPIVSVNPAFTRITGYSAAEVLGKNPRFLQGEDTDSESTASIGRALSQGRSVHVTQKNCRKDGSTFWNDLRIGPVHNDSASPHFFVGLISDVTERVERELHLKKISTALQQSDEAMCTFSRDGSIEYANRAFCRNVGIAPEKVAGTLIWPLWSAAAGRDDGGQSSDVYRQMLAAVREGRSWSGRHTRVRIDGSEYEALTSITPVLEEDGIHSFVAVHRDITELVELESQIAQSQKMEAVGTLV